MAGIFIIFFYINLTVVYAIKKLFKENTYLCMYIFNVYIYILYLCTSICMCFYLSFMDISEEMNVVDQNYLYMI